MEELVDAGLARDIGVSNFSVQLLFDLCTYARIKPSVNQIEMHPYLSQETMVKFCKQVGEVVTGRPATCTPSEPSRPHSPCPFEMDIVVTAYSPFGSGSYAAIGRATEEESVLKVQSHIPCPVLFSPFSPPTSFRPSISPSRSSPRSTPAALPRFASP